MASSGEVTLYYESGSTPCMALMLALEEKGISYTKKLVDTDKDEDCEKLAQLADRDEPPALFHGEVLFDDVVAACLYLDKVFENNRMIPEGPAQRAHVLQRMLQAQKIGVGDVTIDDYWEDPEEDEDMDEAKAEALQEKEDKEELAAELALWEGYLKEQGEGSFIAGSEFTMADCVFIPVLSFLVANELDMTKKYPNLQKYYTRVIERSTFQEVQKFHELEAEGLFKDMPAGGVFGKIKGLFGK